MSPPISSNRTVSSVKDTTSSVAGGKKVVKPTTKTRLPKVSNNLSAWPKTAKSSMIPRSNGGSSYGSDGELSDDSPPLKGASASDSDDPDPQSDDSESPSSKDASADDSKKCRTRQDAKKAIRQKKEKKRKIVEAQKDKDDSVFDNCIATAEKEKKAMVKRAEQVKS
jgi:hypothetical protein